MKSDKAGAAADLQAANEELAAFALKAMTEMLGRMVISGSNRMKLRYDFND